MIRQVHPAIAAFTKQVVDGCRVELHPANSPEFFVIRIVDDRHLEIPRPRKADRYDTVHIPDVDGQAEDWDSLARKECARLDSELSRISN